MSILCLCYYLLFIIYSQTPDHPKLYLWSEQGSKRNEEPPQDKLEECMFTLYNYLEIFNFFLV